MTWDEVINNPFLQNLPFKIELNQFGQILMSPASNKHGAIQFQVGLEITRRRKKGRVITECSIETSDGVKVADVVWASDEFIEEFGMQTPYPKAPEICVEIISPSNSKREITPKVDLYLAKGAQEIWIVSEDQKLMVFTHTGIVKKSKLVPKISLSKR
jgi:Uma2 family endonuclease